MVMKHTRNLAVGAAFLLLVGSLGMARNSLEKQVNAQAKGNMVQVPRYEVDPTYPKPMPNGWYQGQTIGAGMDAQDHLWVIHRPNLSPNEAAGSNKTGECCFTAPPV